VLVLSAGCAGLIPVGASLGQSDTPPPAEAPAAATDEKQPTNAELLADFVHYTLIDKPDLAASFAQALRDRGLSEKEFVALVEDLGVKRFEGAVLKGLRRTESEKTAAALLKSYETGKLSIARNAASITESIAALKGNLRQRDAARQRLIAAGEYAMPQLLIALTQRTDAALQSEARMIIVLLGRQAVMPLCTALPQLDALSQETVARVLGDIQYSTSVPFLYELAASTQSGAVRSACEEAIQKITGNVNSQVSLSGRFVNLAEEYYGESPSLTSFSGEEHQLVWNFDPGIGLVPMAVRTEVYHEAMAMRLSERALGHDAGDQQALSLWLASNFSREIDSPEGYENPTYGADRREAMYYAVAAGATPSQRMLARAIDNNDTPLARKAIAAIERTAGGSALWTGQYVGGTVGTRAPLLEALQFPNRRVQYEAALALGAAQPKSAFDGSDRVVPTLASAIRDASKRYAVVLADAAEKRPAIADALRQAGYEVLPTGGALADIEQALADAPGIDLIAADFSDLPIESTTSLLSDVRGRAKLRSTPVVAALRFDRYNEMQPRYATDQLVKLVQVGGGVSAMSKAAEDLVARATGGPISEEDALSYKARSLQVLRDLAVSGNQALKVQDAATPLIAALDAESGDVMLKVAEVLSYVSSGASQSALMDAAADATSADRIVLLGRVADSAKRFGNMLEPRHIKAINDMATMGVDDEATAAAALMGSLNLPNSDLVPLITGKK
jgi:HEAT repeat protein